MNTLIFGDLHLGSGRSLVLNPQVQEILAPELEWADRVVLNGDILHTGDLKKVALECKAFFAFLSSLVDDLVVVLGNHEMWLLEAARRVSWGEGLESPFPDLLLAKRLFSSFAPSASVEVFYPSLLLPETAVLHGHQLLIAANYRSPLSPEEYHRLLAPWCETFLAFSELSEPPPPALLEGLRARPRLAPRGQLMPLTEVADIAARVSLDHGISPGRVVLGHLHQQFGPLEAQGFEFWSPGCWYFDPYIKELDLDRRSAQPGGVIRANEGSLESRRLLDVFSSDELQAFAG